MNQTESNKTLLFGAGGFLGQHLQVALANQGKVTIDGRWKNDDECSTDKYIERQIPGNTIKSVIHVGIPKLMQESEIEKALEHHVKDVVRIAKISFENGVKQFIWTGSYWQGQDRLDTYSLAKREIQESLKSISCPQFQVSCVHLSDTYGVGDLRDKLIPRFLSNIEKNMETKIESPRNEISPIHVAEAARALVSLLKNENFNSFEVFDLRGDRVLEVIDLADLVKKINPKFQYKIDDDNHMGYKYPVKGKSIPNWNLAVSLEDGLRDLFS